MSNVTSHLVVFDTDSLACNFASALAAFVTGQYGAGEGVWVGFAAREAQPMLQHIDWYTQHVVQIDDEDTDDSQERPAAPWPTPGRFYDGYGKYHNDTPEVRAALGEPRASSVFHAFESVAIFVDELPPELVLAEMVERAKRFCQDNQIGLKGYRLLAPCFEMKPVFAGHNEVDAS